MSEKDYAEFMQIYNCGDVDRQLSYLRSQFVTEMHKMSSGPFEGQSVQVVKSKTQQGRYGSILVLYQFSTEANSEILPASFPYSVQVQQTGNFYQFTVAVLNREVDLCFRSDVSELLLCRETREQLYAATAFGDKLNVAVTPVVIIEWNLSNILPFLREQLLETLKTEFEYVPPAERAAGARASDALYQKSRGVPSISFGKDS